MEFLKQNKKFVFGCSLATLAGVFTLEHIGKKKKWNMKPSNALTVVADKSSLVWETVGKYIAIISGFYHYIDMSDLADTAYQLLLPTSNLVTSPLKTLKGYADTASSYLHPKLVLFGTLTLSLLFGGLYYRRNSFLNNCWLLDNLLIKKIAYGFKKNN